MKKSYTRRRKNLILFSLVLCIFISDINLSLSQNDVCAVYLTSSKCPDCLITDKIVLTNFTLNYPQLVLIEYDIHETSTNQEIASIFFNSYMEKGKEGIPSLIFKNKTFALGKYEIMDSYEIIESLTENPCPLTNESIEFSELDLSKIEGSLRIWNINRVLIPPANRNPINSELAKYLFEAENIQQALENLDEIEYNQSQFIKIKVGADEILFENSIEIDKWRLLWNETKENNGEYEEEDEFVENGSFFMLFAIICIIALIALLIILTPINKKRKRNRRIKE